MAVDPAVKFFPKEHWRIHKLDNHKRNSRDLVCIACEEQGFTAGCYETHTCYECEKISEMVKLEKKVLSSAKYQKGSNKICKDMLWSEIGVWETRKANM